MAPAQVVAPSSVVEAAAMLKKPSDRDDTRSALARVRALETLGDGAPLEVLPVVLASLGQTDAEFDPILAQAHWIAMRDIVARAAQRESRYPASVFSELETAEQSPLLLKVLRAVRDRTAASWAIEFVSRFAERGLDAGAPDWLREGLLQVATIAPDSDIPRVLELLEKFLPDVRSQQEQVLLIAEAQKARAGRLSPKLLELGDAAIANALGSWTVTSTDGAAPTTGTLVTWRGRAERTGDDRAWPTESRLLDRSPGTAPESLPVWSSFGLGERYTGTWTSRAVPAPPSLSFSLVGHNGLPERPDAQRNFVRILVQDPATRDWNEVERHFPPRSDIGRRVSLDLQNVVGRQLRIQVVDGDAGDSFAWIAIGDFSEPGWGPGPARENYDFLKRLVTCFGPSLAISGIHDTATAQAWPAWMQSERVDLSGRVALQSALWASQHPVVSELVERVLEHGWEDLLVAQPRLRDEATGAEITLPAYSGDWSAMDPRSVAWIAAQVCMRSDAAEQEKLALRWSRHRASYPLLEQLMRGGALSKEVLRAFPAPWWEGLSAEDQSRFADLKPEGESDTTRADVVEAKARAVRVESADLAVGARVYQERCAACHQLAGQGKVIGPQLDGAITRTIERLCEDILWPNRNVDEAFRVTNLMTTGGETLSGLVIDRQGESMEVVDQTGKSHRIARDEIETEKISKLSLMPGNFEELLTDTELASLIGFLKSYTPKP
jgi:putative heme-binding domain-containing protein